MLRPLLLLLFIVLASCSSQQTVEVPDGVWHQNEQVGEFSDSWSVCHHFRVVTSDLDWLIDIDVSSPKGRLDASDEVSLVSFSGVSNKSCAVSLYRDNDIACEDKVPVVFPAKNGDGSLRHSKRNPDWESTFNLDIVDLIFDVDGDVVKIDRLRFTNVKYSNFCPG